MATRDGGGCVGVCEIPRSGVGHVIVVAAHRFLLFYYAIWAAPIISPPCMELLTGLYFVWKTTRSVKVMFTSCTTHSSLITLIVVSPDLFNTPSLHDL